MARKAGCPEQNVNRILQANHQPGSPGCAIAWSAGSQRDLVPGQRRFCSLLGSRLYSVY